MLGKLLKHDFKALFRNYGLLFIALFGVTFLYKLYLLLPRNIVLEFTNSLMGVLYVVVILGCLFGTVVINIVRFYKNLVTDEGYLTFPLPVSSKQIIASKLISSLVMDILMAFAILVSTSLLRNDLAVIDDLYRSFEMTLQQIFIMKEYHKLFNVFVLCMGIIFIYTQMAEFTAVAIGQTNRTHKIAAGVGAYALIYFVTQCVMGVTVFLWANKYNLYNVEVDITTLSLTETEILNAVSRLMSMICIVEVVLGVACFFLTDYLFTKKLNLE